MKKTLFLTTALVLIGGFSAGSYAGEKSGKEETMKIIEYNEADFNDGPADYFTGNVKVGSHFASGDFDKYKGAIVNFEAGARTNWHTHPEGQTIVITSGEGRVQIEGVPIQTVKQGDIVWFPQGERHWHGAAPDKAMSHIAIQSSDENGEVVDWMEPVTDEQYQD